MMPASALSVALIVSAGVVASLNVGKLPPALPLLREEFGMTLVQASLLVSFFQLAGMLLGVFGGMLADRFGARRVMLIGLVVAAAGSSAGALAPDAAALLASRALESAGFILTVLPGPALLARHLPAARLRLAMGFWGAYMPTGMTIALVVTPWVYQGGVWRPVWWAVAAALLATAAAIAWRVPADPAEPAGHAPGGSFTLVRDTVGSSRPWLLAAAFGCYAGQWMGVFSFLPTLYAEGGVPLALAGTLTAVGVAVNIAGNVGSGLLLQRGVPRHVLIAVAAAAMGAGAWVCFGTNAPFAVRYGAVLLFSAVGGMIPGTLFATTPAYAAHPRAVSTTTGLMQQGSMVGQFVSPPLIAAVASASAGWHHTWVVTASLALGDLLVALAMARIDRAARVMRR